MKQYCVRAIFTGPIHKDHWHKDAVASDLSTIRSTLRKAEKFYRHSAKYKDEFMYCEIWSREVSEWQKEE